jgi:AcrR family transcriptional regulator
LKNTVKADRIVDAAGRLFARQGYHGTTTREIAHLADVSENTLFRHFDCKEDVFWSALRAHCAELKPGRELLDGMARGDAPEAVLPRILELLADTVNYRPELLRLVAVAFLELHARAGRFCMEHLTPVIAAIHGYLEAGVRQGKIRGLDPGLLTSALIMTALSHQGIAALVDRPRLEPAGDPDGHRAQTRFWLDLLTPPGPAGKSLDENEHESERH